VIVVRLFDTEAPRQRGQYDMVVPNFVRQALEYPHASISLAGRMAAPSASFDFCDTQKRVDWANAVSATAETPHPCETLADSARCCSDTRDFSAPRLWTTPKYPT